MSQTSKQDSHDSKGSKLSFNTACENLAHNFIWVAMARAMLDEPHGLELTRQVIPKGSDKWKRLRKACRHPKKNKVLVVVSRPEPYTFLIYRWERPGEDTVVFKVLRGVILPPMAERIRRSRRA